MTCYLVKDTYKTENYFAVLAEDEETAVKTVRDCRFYPSDDKSCRYLTTFNYPGGTTKVINRGNYPVDDAEDIFIDEIFQKYFNLEENDGKISD